MPNFAKVLTEAQAAAKRLTGRVDTNTAVLTHPSPKSAVDEERSWLEHQYRQMQEQRAMQQAQTAYQQMSTITYSVPSFYESAFGGGLGLANSYVYNYSSPDQRVMPVAQVVDEPSRTMLRRVPVEVQDLDLSDPRKKLAAEVEDLLGYTPLRKELRTPGTLLRVLAKLEIAILEQASVDKYKAQMVEHYRTANKMADPTWRLTPLKHYTQPVPEFVLQKAVEIKRELPEAEFYIDQLAVDPFLLVSLQSIPDYNRNTPSRKLDPETAAYVEVWAEPRFEAEM